MLVSSECRAKTFAEYLQNVQWAVRPATLMEDAPLLEELPVELGPISLKELSLAIQALRANKAAGPDSHPLEYWRAVVDKPGPEVEAGAAWLLDLCNKAWLLKSIPEDWHSQRVALIFKKGDPAECGNYRPICLLNAAYKIFAMILLKRLLGAGADARVSPAQFGFRRNRGTEDALHCARRAIERALAEKHGALHLMALDWQRAFDSINTDALLNALRRFGLPAHLCDVLRSIYTGQTFTVSEGGEQSGKSRQESGICQGCPLSPFLFIIVMTLLMHDAKGWISNQCIAAMEKGRLYDILYADDTLLLGCSPHHVEEFAHAVERAGSLYGMTLHWAKTQALSVATDARLKKLDGDPFKDIGSMQYLGALLSGDGRTDSELSKKLGCARADFIQLQRLWGHSRISIEEKIKYLDFFILS